MKDFEFTKFKEIDALKNQYQEIGKKLEEEISNLKRERSNLNVKAIGENLEKWCDNEFNATNLVANNNIVWMKDNEVVSGTKADFIYKVYADESHNENNILTSAILEMKSEDPQSTNRQVNKI